VTISSVRANMTDMDGDLDLDQLLRDYYAMCEQAGVEPLPPDEAREQAKALTRLLVSAKAGNGAPDGGRRWDLALLTADLLGDPQHDIGRRFPVNVFRRHRGAVRGQLLDQAHRRIAMQLVEARSLRGRRLQNE
jgi:hypothetical protein